MFYEKTLRFGTIDHNSRLSFDGTLWRSTVCWAQILAIIATVKSTDGSSVDLPLCFIFMNDLKEESYCEVFCEINRLIDIYCPEIEKSKQKLDSFLTVSDSE